MERDHEYAYQEDRGNEFGYRRRDDAGKRDCSVEARGLAHACNDPKKDRGRNDDCEGDCRQHCRVAKPVAENFGDRASVESRIAEIALDDLARPLGIAHEAWPIEAHFFSEEIYL